MAERLVERNGQLVEIIWAPIGQLVVHLVPDTFVGVEFRCIRREALKVKPREVTAEFADGLAFVGFAIVPDDDHMAA